MKKCIAILMLLLPIWSVGQPLIEKAGTYFDNKQWDLARQAYAEITAINAYNGWYWNHYATAALQTGHPDEAIHAGKMALIAGTEKARTMCDLGCAYVIADSTGKALSWLEKAIANGYDREQLRNEPMLASLQNNQQFMELLASDVPVVSDRVAKWRADLDYLARQVEQRHYNYLHSISSSDWETKKARIYDAIPKMTDLEIIGSFMKLLAAVGDGHTLLYPPFQGPLAFRCLPLEFYLFEGELFIRGATEDYKALVGAKVLGMGSMAVAEVLAAGKGYVGHDNAMQLRWILPIALTFSDFYTLMGASKAPDALSLTLQDAQGASFKATVQAGPALRDPMSRFVPPNWVDMKGEGGALWTSDPENNYWYTYLADRQVVYCQWNQVRDKADQDIAAFAKEVCNFVNENNVEALVLDIRLNNGGNSFLNDPFVHELIKCEKINRHGKLFTIIGRRTFSAAMNLASELERHTETIFVGEPTGSKPNFYGEDSGFSLPYSGLKGSISSRYWQGGETSDDSRNWIAPHLAADLSVQHYIHNEDPAMDAIFEYLEAAHK